MVPGRGLEPPQDCSRQLLRLMRLPVSPPRRVRNFQKEPGSPGSLL